MPRKRRGQYRAGQYENYYCPAVHLYWPVWKRRKGPLFRLPCALGHNEKIGPIFRSLSKWPVFILYIARYGPTGLLFVSQPSNAGAYKFRGGPLWRLIIFILNKTKFTFSVFKQYSILFTVLCRLFRFVLVTMKTFRLHKYRRTNIKMAAIRIL